MRLRWLTLVTAAALFAPAPQMQAGLFDLSIPLPLGLGGGRKEDPAELLKTGRAALEDGLYEMASDSFTRYVRTVGRSTPEGAAGVTLLAEALNGQGKYDDMVDLLVPARDPGHSFWLAMAYHGQGRDVKALSEIDRLQATWTNDLHIARGERLRSRCLFQSGHTNEAVAVCEAIEDKFGRSPEAPGNLLDWAKMLVSMGRTREACDVLRLLVDSAGRSGEAQEARQALGALLIREQKWKEAGEVLRPLAEMKDALIEYKAGACFLLAEVLGAQQDFAGATNTLQRAVELSASDSMRRRGVISLGRLLLKIGRLSEGISVLKPVITASHDEPATGFVQLDIADALLASGAAPAAAREYQSYLDTFISRPGTARALAGKAWALLALPEPRYAEAADLFQRAFEHFEAQSDKAQCLLKVADSRFKNGQYTVAAETYARVAAEFPASGLASQARLQVAESHAAAGRGEEAVKLFEKLAGEGSAGSLAEQAMLRIAELKESEGNLMDALDRYGAFMKAYSNSPYHATALLGHGLVQYRLGEFTAALADFEAMQSLFPTNRLTEQAYYMRGWCHHKMGAVDQAIMICEAFVSKFPASQWTPDVLFWLGEQEFNRGSYGRAENWFVQVSDRFPQHALADAALYRAGKCSMQRKEYLKANDCFRTLASRYPASPRLGEARFEQGDVLCELGQYSTAILVFEEVIRHGDSALVNAAWGRKGDCEFALGTGNADRYEAAINSYRVVANSVTAPPEVRLQAQYKIGRCLFKMGQVDRAFDQYYKKVVLPYLEGRSTGAPRDASAEIWFTQAAVGAADILESRKEWTQAINILARVEEAGVPGALAASERINSIRRRMLQD